MDVLFDACMRLLLFTSRLIGLSYEALNVIIFCILVPLAFYGLLEKLLHTKQLLHLHSEGAHGWSPKKARMIRSAFTSLAGALFAAVALFAFLSAQL